MPLKRFSIGPIHDYGREESVLGVGRSASGFQGQMCSACSRLARLAGIGV
ncbi:MAG: hypothetical protein IPP07_05925 [Holophagales bacterium]|jgi:hypothetical protein|nr:hypothetical protein [Holophagales bacterium]MBK9964448.1 hypothetical protein [Holophagales bacterium]